MIEKIDITNAGIISSIEGKLNVKNIRDGMFPTWRLTLQPGEEYDLGTPYYGIYLIKSGDIASTALVLIGAAASTNILLSNGEGISTDFTASDKLILNKKILNGNVFVKNTRPLETIFNVMQITNY